MNLAIWLSSGMTSLLLTLLGDPKADKCSSMADCSELHNYINAPDWEDLGMIREPLSLNSIIIEGSLSMVPT
jgi:hypothetical protein